jgi:hypothetical protein
MPYVLLQLELHLDHDPAQSLGVTVGAGVGTTVGAEVGISVGADVG